MKTENLKCCGNCKYRYVIANSNLCQKENDPGCCKEWEFDGLTNKERMNENV